MKQLMVALFLSQNNGVQNLTKALTSQNTDQPATRKRINEEIAAAYWLANAVLDFKEQP